MKYKSRSCDQCATHNDKYTYAIDGRANDVHDVPIIFHGSLHAGKCAYFGPAVAPRQLRLRSALVVLVVAAPPDVRLVAPLGGAVEPLVHAPEAVQSARIGGIAVVDDAVLQHERAHARPLARVRGRVGSGHGRVVAARRPRPAV